MDKSNKIRLLLVDDHKILRDGLKKAIGQESDMILVGEAENGRTAFKLARETLPDVIIMDISMPDLNGIEAARQIIRQNRDQKIIALSMHADKHYVLGMLKAGVKGYILKTNAFEELAQAVRIIMKGQPFISRELTGIVVKSAVTNLQCDTAKNSETLTSREIEILQLIAEGKNSDYMAVELNISRRTIEVHRRNLKKKLKLNTIADLTRYAIKTGIISL